MVRLAVLWARWSLALVGVLVLALAVTQMAAAPGRRDYQSVVHSQTLHADFPAQGLYRVFIQFQTGGQLHTVPITVVAK